jgi:hypothetical protein
MTVKLAINDSDPVSGYRHADSACGARGAFADSAAGYPASCSMPAAGMTMP